MLFRSSDKNGVAVQRISNGVSLATVGDDGITFHTVDGNGLLRTVQIEIEADGTV